MTALTGIYIGTSGWSYPRGEGTWNGYFYPKGTKDELTYYSRFFRAVEINSSFYYPLNPIYTGNWIKKVPAGFCFTVKLWQKFTHPGMFKEATGEEAVISGDDVALFNKGIAPLAEAGKLGALLAQFPPSFKNDDYGWQILRAVIRTFNQHHLAIELRHRSWSDDYQTSKIFRDSNVSWVRIDEPKFSSSVAADLPATAEVAYFRFHGRNQENWWQGDNETRYKYIYSLEEIKELSEKVSEASAKAKLTFVFFNNHWQGYAPRNATDLQKSLGLLFNEPVIQATLDKPGQV
jgi:uncharacterized protein YecE (DUF72 family)